MARKEIAMGRSVDVPDDLLHPLVLEGLRYFEKMFAQTYKRKQGQTVTVTWEMMRPRMIRVLEDLYDLEGEDDEKMAVRHRVHG